MENYINKNRKKKRIIGLRNTLLAVLSLISSSLFADTPTKILIYRAYNPGGGLNPNIVIAQHYTGSCLSRSLVNSGRSDAVRCVISNLILDPCFLDKVTVACIISPWSHKTAIVNPENTILNPDRSVNTKTAAPWALELVSGERCTFLTGTSTLIDDVRVNYTCENSSLSVIGDIDRSSSTWKAKVYDFTSHSISKKPIVNAWF